MTWIFDSVSLIVNLKRHRASGPVLIAITDTHRTARAVTL